MEGVCSPRPILEADPPGTSLQRVPLPEQDVPPGAAWKPEVDRKEGNPGASRHNNTVLIRPPHTHQHVNAPPPGVGGADVLVSLVNGTHNGHFGRVN